MSQRIGEALGHVAIIATALVVTFRSQSWRVKFKSRLSGFTGSYVVGFSEAGCQELSSA